MEMFNHPVIQRAMTTVAETKAFSTRFAKLTVRDNKAAAKLMTKFARQINVWRKEQANMENGVIPQVDERHRELGNLILKLRALADNCANYAYRNGYNRLPYIVYVVRIKKELGTLKNLGRLRGVMSYCEHAPDKDDCVAFINKKAEITRCPDCGDWEYVEKNQTVYRGTPVCRQCAANSYVFSTVYNQLIYSDDARWCRMPNGASEAVLHCDDDNAVYNEDEDYWHHVDYVPPPPPIIGNYHSSKAHQRVIRDDWSVVRNNRYFGVELEVEYHGSEHREDKARQLHAALNGGQFGHRCFFENDGSVSNGFEIVSQPMSLPMHRDFWQWLNDKDLTRYLKSHNTSTCGLHVHVSREGMDSLVLAKAVTFVNAKANSELIRSVARRYAEGYCKIKQKDVDNALQTTDRYEAVNVVGRKTVEFRIFKGSLKYESVIAAVEFTHALLEFCKTAEPKSLGADEFIDFLNNVFHEETAILRPYLAQRFEIA